VLHRPSPADFGVDVHRRGSSINSSTGYPSRRRLPAPACAPTTNPSMSWLGRRRDATRRCASLWPSALLPSPRRRRDGTAGLQPRRPCTGAGDAAMSALVVLWLRWCCCWWHGDGALLLLLPPRPWRRRDGAADATPASTSTSSAAIAMWAISHSSPTLSMALC
jgi:hypothetical protein